MLGREKFSGTFSELMPLLVQEPIREGEREVEDRTSWKPEVPFMAGSFESPVRESSHTRNRNGVRNLFSLDCPGIIYGLPSKDCSNFAINLLGSNLLPGSRGERI